MNPKFIVFLCFFTLEIALGQVDKDGRPIEFPVQIDSSEYENFTLKVDYLSIKDNQDNKKSALHIWDNPTYDNYLMWAKSMTSYEFRAFRNGDFYIEISLKQKNIDNEEKYVYSLIKPGLGLYDTNYCSIKGKVTEHRARELIENNYDKTAFLSKRDNSEFITFNRSELLILNYSDIKREVVQLIDSIIVQEISKDQEIKSNPIDYIKRESIEGELDFSKMLVGYAKGNSKEKIYLYSIALWSGAVKELGISDIDKIIELWEEIHSKKANKKIKNAIMYGYKME